MQARMSKRLPAIVKAFCMVQLNADAQVVLFIGIKAKEKHSVSSETELSSLQHTALGGGNHAQGLPPWETGGSVCTTSEHRACVLYHAGMTFNTTTRVQTSNTPLSRYAMGSFVRVRGGKERGGASPTWARMR